MATTEILLPKTLLVLDADIVECAGRLYSPFPWWRFARALSRHCAGLTLYVPFKKVDDPGEAYPVDLGSMTLATRPYYRRFYGYYAGLPLSWRRLRRTARELVNVHELVIGRMPGPATKMVAKAAVKAGKQVALLVAGDVLVGSHWDAAASAVRRFVGRLLGGVLRGQENWVARHAAFVGVWDTQMRARFEALCSNVAECQSPNISADMLEWREDTCGARPIRLLRVCRLSAVKNVELVLDTLAKLVQAGRDVVLDIVGEVGVASYVSELKKRVERLDLSSRVFWRGGLAFGEPLFGAYRQADIHVVSSSWEGVPRVIAEARALCVPTVATRVGGIPSVIVDREDGLLTEPNVDAMYEAVIRMMDDAELRRRIIRSGFAKAQQSTAEFHARRLAELIGAALAK